MGFVGGDRDAERLHGILPGDQRGPFLPDRVEEILELPAQRFLLPHVDLLLVVLERNLVEVERVQRAEGAGTHGDRLLRVVDLDEAFQAGQGELPHLHRREPEKLRRGRLHGAIGHREFQLFRQVKASFRTFIGVSQFTSMKPWTPLWNRRRTFAWSSKFPWSFRPPRANTLSTGAPTRNRRTSISCTPRSMTTPMSRTRPGTELA